MLSLSREVCSDPVQAASHEWLETNGLGGYAASTVCGMNTRRYHALLIASLVPPVERYVLLSRLEETLVVDGRRYELATNQFPGAVHPQGYRYLSAFTLAPYPVFTWEVAGVTLRKSVAMVHGENTTVIRYEVEGAASPATLELRALLAFREHHSLTHENPDLNPSLQAQPGVVSVTPYPGLPTLHLAHDADALDETGYWYRRFEYPVERERGQDYEEDLFSPFGLHFDLGTRRTATVIASLVPHAADEGSALLEAEAERREAILRSAPSEELSVPALSLAADAFLVRRGEGRTVIAGYPWFTDWSRDTMISLPGLTLVTGRYEAARGILAEFARHVDHGLLPNRFPDAGEAPETNTVDATLWFFETVRALIAYTGDYDFVRETLYPTLVDIIDWHVRGTLHGIAMDADGLLQSGEEGLQLTWMDARVGDRVITPRRGKPVEIQALWYHALRVMESLAQRFHDESRAQSYGKLASRAQRSFNRQFWNAELGCLYDVVAADGPDPSLRPNQVLAVSLAHSMLSARRAASVVKVVQRHLLTPYGLRTLSPDDPRYCGIYAGDGPTRDACYHQGTVWPWLLGPFLTAYLRVHGHSTLARAQAREWLAPLQKHLGEAGLGSISEVFDGDPPHHPGGCIAQAWSVGELLRATVEDVLVPRDT